MTVVVEGSMMLLRAASSEKLLDGTYVKPLVRLMSMNVRLVYLLYLLETASQSEVPDADSDALSWQIPATVIRFNN